MDDEDEELLMSVMKLMIMRRMLELIVCIYSQQDLQTERRRLIAIGSNYDELLKA